MPKIFEYLGLSIYFFSNEHEPIHVHAKYSEFESKAEFIIIDGIITEIKIKKVRGRKPLTGSKLSDFQTFLKYYAQNIVQKWVEYFVMHKEIECEFISKKLK